MFWDMVRCMLQKWAARLEKNGSLHREGKY